MKKVFFLGISELVMEDKKVFSKFLMHRATPEIAAEFYTSCRDHATAKGWSFLQVTLNTASTGTGAFFEKTI